jgi:outer membrane protein
MTARSQVAVLFAALLLHGAARVVAQPTPSPTVPVAPPGSVTPPPATPTPPELAAPSSTPSTPILNIPPPVAMNAPVAVPSQPAAPPTEPAVPLTLAQAGQLALSRQPDILQAMATAGEAAQQARASRAAYFPTLTGELTGSQGQDNAVIGAGALSASKLFNRFGAGLQLSQLVTDFGRTPNLVAGSRLHAEAAGQSVNATRADVLLGVHRAYFEALAGQALIKVAQQTIDARQTLADQTSALAQHSLRSELDVSFASANLAQAKLLLLRAQDRLAEAFAELTRAIGGKETATYVLSEEPLPAAPDADPEHAVGIALNHRPDLEALRKERDSTHRLYEAEHDLGRPIVSVVGVVGDIPYLEQPPGGSIPSSYEGAAINIEVPLFNGFLNSARAHAARFRADASDQRVNALEQRIARDVRQTWASARTAFERLTVAGYYVSEAKRALDLAEGRYGLGLSSIVELTQAQLTLTEAQIEELSARYEYQSQEATLRYLTGALH